MATPPPAPPLNALPFFPLDELGPLFATGFLTSSLATAVAIVAGYQIISASRKTTRLRLGLTIIFLVDIILFIGGQTSALTFTSVSEDCTQRNILLTFADQFARVSSLIVGLNIVSRGQSLVAKFALCGWFLGRLAVGIVDAALVQNEFGVVCLPAPDLVPAVIGAVMDFSLDIFLIFRSLRLYAKAYENDKPSEFVVFLSSIALLAWHLTSIPMSFRVGDAAARIVPYCILLSILTYLLVIFHIKVPTPNQGVIRSNSVHAPRQLSTSDIESQVPAPLTPKLLGGLFAPFRRISRGSTLTGQVTQPDTEPPLMRYAIEKPRSASASFYNLVRLPTRSRIGTTSAEQTPTEESLRALGLSLPPPPSSRARLDAFPRAASVSPSQSFQTPLADNLSLPLSASRLKIGMLTEPPSPVSKGSEDSRAVSEVEGRISSEAPTIRTATTTYEIYPVTSMPMPSLPVAKVPTIRRVDQALDLKLTIPDKAPSRVTQLESPANIVSQELAKRLDSPRRDRSRSPASSISSQGKRLPALPDGRKAIIFPPVSKNRRTRSKLSVDIGGPPPSIKDLDRLPPSTPPPAPPSTAPKLIKRRPSPRDQIPSDIYKRLSQDLASLVDPDTPPARQNALYNGMLTMLSEVMEGQGESAIGNPVGSFPMSSREKTYLEVFPIDPADPRHTSVSTGTATPVRSLTHSKFFPDEALTVLRSILPHQVDQVNTLSLLLETERLSTEVPRAELAISPQAEIALTERLNKKLHDLDDTDSIFEVEAIVNPMKPRKLSQTSLEILESLEEEFEDVRIQLEARPGSLETFSSLSFSSFSGSPGDAEKSTPQTSPVWRPSAEVAAAAGRMPSPSMSPETNNYDSPDRSSIVYTPQEMYPRSRSGSRVGLWSSIQPIEEEHRKPGLWRSESVGTTATSKREHGDFNFNLVPELPRLPSLSRKRVASDMEPRSNRQSLWKPTPIEEPSLWRPERNTTINHVTDEVGLWKPLKRAKSEGLWMSSAQKRNSIRIHKVWKYTDPVRYPSRSRTNDLPSTPDFNGLWRRSTSKRSTRSSGLWKTDRRSKFAAPGLMLPSLPFRLSSFGDEIEFIIDSRRSSRFSQASEFEIESEDAHQLATSSAPTFPPIFSQSDIILSGASSPTLFTPSDVETSIGTPLPPPPPLRVANDVSVLHPVFINSNLDPRHYLADPKVHQYPVDRLHPVCIGYYHHSEYEIAMASVRAIEDLYRRSVTETPITPPISEETLQHRRSLSITPIQNTPLILERNWKNRLANLTVNLEGISSMGRSPFSAFSQTPATSSRYSSE